LSHLSEQAQERIEGWVLSGARQRAFCPRIR
jgi:hypothetical protein